MTASACSFRKPTRSITAGGRRSRFRPAPSFRSGSDTSGKPLGLHPKLTGVLDIFNQGRLALIQRVGYANSSRSHFQGTDIWSTANPSNSQGPGWLGQYLATLTPPLDPLVAWNTVTESPHTLQSPAVSVASIPDVKGTRSRARTAAPMRCSTERPRRTSRRTCPQTSRSSRLSPPRRKRR